jgi:hypothetical protein
LRLAGKWLAGTKNRLAQMAGRDTKSSDGASGCDKRDIGFGVGGEGGSTMKDHDPCGKSTNSLRIDRE